MLVSLGGRQCEAGTGPQQTAMEGEWRVGQHEGERGGEGSPILAAPFQGEMNV